MRFYPIDFNTSIQQQRIVYKKTPDFILECITLVFTTAFAVGPVTFLAFITFQSIFDIFQVMLCLIWDAFIGINIVLLHTLVKIDGKNKRDNKRDILKVLSKNYQLQKEHPMRNGIIRDIQVDTFSRWGRVITCLFDDNCVYINVTTVYKTDSFSCFNGLYNYNKCKKIAKDFRELQASAPQNDQNVI